MEQLAIHIRRKASATLDQRLVALVKLLAKNAAEEDNAVIQTIKPDPPFCSRGKKDSK